ncbi:hypothetical protein A5746_08475 [Mycolicibacterium conceptionense]|uniref:DUF2306 domain-containing protein n=1 Tax=Mycolicibacterium conceptionense TaxID=451644 RepID=UPI0007EC468A|nr:DUF2306 domain-containing protein [Mycolicibacterium conceptionense]OBJ96799.1 hypothetical protein A5639_31445 [Mycolicibacterium conceptionense]OMB77876.1 hypothetical protein A5741_29725 [Mycolicibacterium conceptionense]OMB78378.1 hypothetical protein A5746_08475 [Mycolicibacterium conceptionense]
MIYASLRSVRWAAALTVIVTVFLVYSLPPYLTGGTRVQATFGLHYPLLVAHVLLASVAMVCAVAQVWPGLRRRHPAWHRRTGRIYAATAIPATLCAIVIGAATPFGPILGVGNVVLAALWFWFTVDGFLAARQRRFGAHRRQMLRSATLALSIITNRVWTPVLYLGFDPLRDSIFGGNEEKYVWVVAGVGGWLGWTIPLLLLQVWLRRHPGTGSEPVPMAASVPR